MHPITPNDWWKSKEPQFQPQEIKQWLAKYEKNYLYEHLKKKESYKHSNDLLFFFCLFVLKKQSGLVKPDLYFSL